MTNPSLPDLRSCRFQLSHGGEKFSQLSAWTQSAPLRMHQRRAVWTWRSQSDEAETERGRTKVPLTKPQRSKITVIRVRLITALNATFIITVFIAATSYLATSSRVHTKTLTAKGYVIISLVQKRKMRFVFRNDAYHLPQTAYSAASSWQQILNYFVIMLSIAFI